MAGKQTVGSALEIPESVLGNLLTAQQRIEKLAESTENFITRTSGRFSQAMVDMASASAQATNDISQHFSVKLPQALQTFFDKATSVKSEINKIFGGLDVPKLASRSATIKIKPEVDFVSLATLLEKVQTKASKAFESIKPIKVKLSGEWLKDIKTQVENAQKALKSLHIPNLNVNLNTKGGGKGSDLQKCVIDAEAFAKSLKPVIDALEKMAKSISTASDAIQKMFANAGGDTKGLVTVVNDMIDRMTRLSTEIANVKGSLRTMAVPLRESVDAPGSRRLPEVYKAISREISAVNRETKAMEKRIEKAEEVLRKYGSYAATLQTRMEQLRETGARFRQELEYLNEKPMNANLLVNMAGNAETRREIEASIRRLRTEMSKMNPNTKEWEACNQALQKNKEQLNEIKKKMGELQTHTKTSTNMFMQLKNAMFAAFSVQTITGYLKKMVEVHAEMRLQNVALRAILQNKDEADRIFMQVQQMALRSPFSIMQMTTYTKQLAAYRIEADKLVQTTKMLADVSAGLGVDMQRLILAYGQVKSANYLRATEVRQFTEAGLNIAGELAKYYSETKNQMVTVADVMDMITKRMVKFEDVEEIFKRITSAGGLFYDMQKKQSDTVWGQMQRIKDAYTIMMDEIGQSNGGVIQKVLTGLRGLFANWRKYSLWLIEVGVGFGLYKAAVIAANLSSTKFGKTLNALMGTFAKTSVASSGLSASYIRQAASARLAATALKTLASAAMGLIALGAGVVLVSIIDKINELATAGDEAAEALGRIRSEAAADSEAAEARYKTLANTVRDLTKSSKERQEALEELNRTYGEYLPKQMLEYEGIVKMTGAYDQATIAIRQHYAEIEKQKRVEYYQGEFDKKLQKWVSEDSQASRIKSITGLNDAELEAATSKAIKWAKENGKTSAKELYQAFLDELQRSASLPAGSLFGIEGEGVSIQNDLKPLLDSWNNVISAQKEYAINIDDIADNSLDKLSNGLNQFAQRLKADPKEIKTIFQTSIAEGVQNGFTKAEQYFNLFNQKLMDRFGKTANLNSGMIDGFETWMYAAKSANDYKLSLEGLTKAQKDALLNDIETAEQEKEAWESRKQAAADLEGLYLRLQDAKKQYEEGGGEGDFFETPQGNSIVQEIQAMYEDGLKIPAPDTSEIKEAAEQSKEDLRQIAREAGKESGIDFIENFKKRFPELGPMLQRVLDYFNQEVKKFDLTPVQQECDTVIDNIEAKYNQRGLFDQIKRDAIKSAESVGKTAKGMYEEYAEQLESYARGLANGLTPLIAQLLFLGNQTKEEVEQKMNAAKELANTMGVVTDKKSRGGGGRSHKPADPWLKVLETMKKLNSEYEKTNKYYNDFETRNRILVGYADEFKTTMSAVKSQFKDINSLMGDLKFDKADMIASLESMTKNINNKETLRKFQETIGQFKVELDFDVQKNALEEMKKRIELAFNNYELSNLVVSMGLDIDLVSKLGGMPIGSIEELEAKIQSIYSEFNATYKLGEEAFDYQRQSLKKIDDYEAKQRQEQLKNYLKYFKESMSERGKIIMDAYQQQNQIMRDNNLDNATKGLAMQQVAEKMKDELAKQDWEDFKGTDMYIQMFESLDFATTQSIERMRAKIEDLKTSWQDAPPTQIKAMIKEIDKLDKELRSRDPFGAIITSYKKITELQSKGLTREVLDRQLEDYTNIDLQLQNQITELEAIESLMVTRAKGGEITADQEKLLANYQGKSVDEIGEMIKRAKELKKTNRGNIDQTNENIQAYKDYLEALEEGKKKWQEFSQQAKKAYDIIKDLLENMGVDMENVGGIIAEGALNLVDMAVQLVFQIALWKMMSIAVKDAMGPIGWILIALEAVVTIFTTIFKASDKAKQNKIDKLKESVEELSDAYDRLKESIENAYKFDDYNAGMILATTQLKAQIEAYQKMIQLESSKRKKDKDAIKEYQNNIKELHKQLLELENDKTKAFGGFGNDGRLDAAQSFVDAWLDAFKETGDGLDALGEQWDNYIENLLKKQAAYRIVGRRMEVFFNKIDEMANAHSEWSMKQILDQVMEMEGDVFVRANEELKEFFNYFGWGNDGNMLLSDLQKGIQNITEEQAAALESITNSIRFGVYQQLSVLQDIYGEISSQYRDSDSPMLSEVKGIRRLVANIDTNISSVISRNSGRASVRIN